MRCVHDDFGQRLALFAVELEQLGQQVSKVKPGAGAQVGKLLSRSQELATDLHDLSHWLHPAILDQLGLVPAVQSLCREFSEKIGIQIGFSERKLPTSVSNGIALCLYRIVQELLRNVEKHSSATEAKVELSAGQDEIHLRVSDDGVGFEPAADRANGLGLVSIKERLYPVRGQVSILSRPAQGTCIDVSVPLVVSDNEGKASETRHFEPIDKLG